MNKKIKKPELKCPVKNWASLEACKDYADAVYFGCDLSLRSRAHGIKLGDLDKFVKKAHSYNIKAYLTVNSAIYNKDLTKVDKVLNKAKDSNIDGVIVWDPATIMKAKELGLNIIISTQANISNYESAKFYQKMGAKRVVLAREMTLKQIKELRDKVKTEVEVFVHGAMCMAISGRCLLSSYLFGKSANCGSCAQPCRKEWFLTDDRGHKISTEGQFFMNAKDLCMIEYIPELIKAGIDSFKIEGRKRDPKYIQTVSKYYRLAIDSYFDGTYTKAKAKEWKEEMNKVYNRGFSTGFFFGELGKEGISYNEADNVSGIKKYQVGYVTHYFPKIKVALINLCQRGLKVGEKVAIEGDKTFFEQEVESMEREKETITRGKKGEEIGIKVKQRVRVGDNLFIFK
jgi:putative protease